MKPSPLILGFIVFIVSLIHATQLRAAPVEGKWGLGVGTGDFLGSSAEATVLYGRSEKTAWLIQVTVSGNGADQNDVYIPYVPDTVITQRRSSDSFSFLAGPGLRRYVRERGNLSAYVDVTVRFLWGRSTTDRVIGSDGVGEKFSQWGVESGFALGAEYFFERWPVSLAAHSGILGASYRDSKRTYSLDGGADAEAISNGWSVSGGVGPRLQARVYF